MISEEFIDELLDCFGEIHKQNVKFVQSIQYLKKKVDKLEKELEQHRLRTGDY